ncbi:MAG: hypothetical protein HQL14_07580 [Candidatus Omnitrophica bacterium]|nr:hypothetical protein [Candidatus Omnitrophota bacterium]
MKPSQLKDINKLPAVIQGPVSQFALKLLEKLTDNIKAILVHGSSAGINYNPGVSNVNVAIIVEKLDFNVLKQVFGLLKEARRHKIAPPLLLTQEYVNKALDVFPIEFSEIKERHITIFGDDFFTNLDIPLKDVRLLCEQQVKGKLLHLRQAYLTIGSSPAMLKNFVSKAFSDLLPVFRRLIDLKGEVPCERKEDMLHQLAVIFSLDGPLLLALYHDKAKKILISPQQVELHFQNFINQLETLSRHMDSL